MVCRVVILAIFLAGCATAKPWTKEEKVLLGASCLAALADTITTLDGLHRGAEETNPIMGRHPSDTMVVSVMAIAQISTIIAAHYLSDFREWILGVKTVANAACTFHNLRINH